MATRRKFSAECKAEEVAMVIDSGRSMAEVTKNIGVRQNTLSKAGTLHPWLRSPAGTCQLCAGSAPGSWSASGSQRRMPNPRVSGER